jgi:threonine/homoserine/homoserine lactone efflux protein
MTMLAFLAAVLPFAIAMSFTPGPNNLMLASSGARFGFMRTLPHQAGIVVGFAIMTLALGLGIAALIAAVPAVYFGMRIASLIYMVWLAWQIATAEGAKTVATQARPIGFVAAAAFQWINPKAWIMTLTAVATYTTPRGDLRMQIVMLTIVFAIVGAASSSTWVTFGQLIRRYLTSQRRRVLFNRTMALLLVGSIVPALFKRW